MNKGTLYALGAYTLWGVFPIYWKAFQRVDALEILSHRMIWLLVVMIFLLTYQRRWQWLRPALRSRRTVMTFLASATLLAINWFVYIWAVHAGFIVETSLGYFINPLINVLFGAVFLRERLRLWQAAAILTAVCGVLYLTLSYGALPWIALTLAFSFALYGLLRKTAALNALEGLSLEALFFFGPALLYLLHREAQGIGSFGHTDGMTHLLLLSTGVVTAVPLLLFAMGARRTTFTTLGILQYVAPTCQFLIGVYLYGEPFTPTQLIGFSLIWLALFIYTTENIITGRRTAKLQYP